MFWGYLIILVTLVLNSGDVDAISKGLKTAKCESESRTEGFVPHSYIIQFGIVGLPLTIYYESQCEDSRRFIVEQLQPAVQMLHSYLSLKLIPFGKSKSIDDGYGGFECQHGPAECLGNLVQDCVLEIMANRTDVDKVAYVACEMNTQAGTKGNLQCAEDMQIPRDPVKYCIMLDQGLMLQLNSEYQTSLVAPKFVPTVTIGRNFNQQIQDISQIDLIGTLCSFLKDKPPCAHHYNSLALKYVLHGAAPEHGYKP